MREDEKLPTPEYTQIEDIHGWPTDTAGLKIAVVVFVAIAGIALIYAWLQHDAAQQYASERAEMKASLAQARSQENALTAQVDALTAAQARADAARTAAANNQQFPPRTSEAAPAAHNAARHTVRRRSSADDPRWKQVQQQLGDEQKQLAAHQAELAKNQQQIDQTQTNLEQAKSELSGNLQSARTELGGDIARNHSELVALQKKGERNYYEFSFEKSKTYHHTGPVSIALRKADSKHEYCDLQMLVDDRTITRKHVNLYESVSFYPEGYPLPVEVVINRIDNNSVHGYVSEPKYRSVEQAAAPAATPATAAAPATSASVTPPGSGPNAKLEHRQDTAVH